MLSESDETMEEAFSLWRVSLRNSTEALGPNHSGTLTTARNFVQQLVLRQRSAEARVLCAQCLTKADDNLYKDNVYGQKVFKEIKNIWQDLFEADTGDGVPLYSNDR